MISFQVLDPRSASPSPDPFDVIVCRNLPAHADLADRRHVLERICCRLASDGFLYLREADAAGGVVDRLDPLSDQSGIYRLAQAA